MYAKYPSNFVVTSLSRPEQSCNPSNTHSSPPTGQYGGLTPIDSLDSPYATTPKSSAVPYSPEGESFPAHSGDSFCGSDISFEEGRMDQFDDQGEM